MNSWNKKKRKALQGSLLIILAAVALGIGCYRLLDSNHNQKQPMALGPSPTSEAVSIEGDLARFVADQQVLKFYPGFEWRSLDRLTLYDVEGEVCAYAIISAKGDMGFRSAEDLRRHIREGWAELEKARQDEAQAEPNTEAAVQAKSRVVQAERSLYRFDDLATVITSGTTGSKLILRHFRGLPEFWVNAEAIDEAASLRRYGKALSISGVLMITPMDFRLVATEAGAAGTLPADLRSSDQASFPDKACVLSSGSERILTFAEVRKERQAIEARKQHRLETLEPAERARYEQALQVRAKALSDEWQQNRDLWIESRHSMEAK